jgi:predicted phosphate transport protein (TIGR00153 family)
MVSLRKLFKPGTGKFHDFFDEAAANLVDMSGIFITAIYESDPEKRNTYLAELEALESANDKITHKLFIELGKKFITPFDREDIHSLITTLDDIADYMYAIIKQLKYYHIAEVPQPSKNVANNLQLMIKKLAEAVNQLKDKRSLEKLYPLCQEIKKKADLCSSLTDAAITRIYSDEQNPYEVIKKLDHYEMVHSILGRCYNATNVIESVIVKYA